MRKRKYAKDNKNKMMVMKIKESGRAKIKMEAMNSVEGKRCIRHAQSRCDYDEKKLRKTKEDKWDRSMPNPIVAFGQESFE